MRILLTGCAGFIGYHLSKKLSNSGFKVIGVDNINDYYSIKLKNERIKKLENFENFQFFKFDISKANFNEHLEDKNIDLVVHLAAQAGVRNSFKMPLNYINSNIIGTFNILEFCAEKNIDLLYASSSSVYGDHNNSSSEEKDSTENPTSLYALTKKSNEMMVKIYCDHYHLNAAGLRFFTIYGEYGRPDMAYWIFTENALNGDSIEVFGDGSTLRDFTYIETAIEAMISIINNFNKIKGHEVFNIGNKDPRSINDLLGIIENHTNSDLKIFFKDKDKFDVGITSANTNKFESLFGKLKHITLEQGISNFIKWYKEFK